MTENRFPIVRDYETKESFMEAVKEAHQRQRAGMKAHCTAFYANAWWEAVNERDQQPRQDNSQLAELEQQLKNESNRFDQMQLSFMAMQQIATQQMQVIGARDATIVKKDDELASLRDDIKLLQQQTVTGGSETEAPPIDNATPNAAVPMNMHTFTGEVQQDTSAEEITNGARGHERRLMPEQSDAPGPSHQDSYDQQWPREGSDHNSFYGHKQNRQTCYNCRQHGHKKFECPIRLQKKQAAEATENWRDRTGGDFGGPAPDQPASGVQSAQPQQFGNWGQQNQTFDKHPSDKSSTCGRKGGRNRRGRPKTGLVEDPSRPSIHFAAGARAVLNFYGVAQVRSDDNQSNVSRIGGAIVASLHNAATESYGNKPSLKEQGNKATDAQQSGSMQGHKQSSAYRKRWNNRQRKAESANSESRGSHWHGGRDRPSDSRGAVRHGESGKRHTDDRGGDGHTRDRDSRIAYRHGGQRHSNGQTIPKVHGCRPGHVYRQEIVPVTVHCDIQSSGNNPNGRGKSACAKDANVRRGGSPSARGQPSRRGNFASAREYHKRRGCRPSALGGDRPGNHFYGRNEEDETTSSSNSTMTVVNSRFKPHNYRLKTQQRRQRADSTEKDDEGDIGQEFRDLCRIEVK